MSPLTIAKVPKIYLLMIAIIIVWGLSWPVSKIGLAYMAPIWFISFRLLIGTSAMFLIVASMKRLALPRRVDLPIIFVIGLLQVAIFMLFVNLGLDKIAAGRSAILVYTTPLWVIPLAILFFDEKVVFLQWIGFFLGLIGIIILLSPWTINWSDKQTLLGNGYLMIAALCWAISMLCARNMQWTRPPIELIPWQLLIATIPLTLLALYQEPYTAIQWNGNVLACIFYTGILATAFGYWGTVVISKELPSSTASLSFLGVPLSGYIFSILILHEEVETSVVFALLFILAGLICIALNKPK